MTVCIAALCTDGDEPRVVVAADRMVTLGSFIEFEHAMRKMTAASPYAIAMIAGDTLVGTRLAREAAEVTASSNPGIDEIARQLATEYENTRRTRMQEDLLTPRALDLESFYGAHNALNPQIVAMIDNQMSQYNLGVEVLLAGVDSSGAHVYSVQNPGGAERLHDIIGYAAIGSGAIHAVQSMIGFGHTANAGYHETVFRAHASKRRAEAAPGVGAESDIAVISSTSVHWLTDPEMEQLDEIYGRFSTATAAQLAEELQDFKLGDDRADDPDDDDTDS
jgi:20S proteasome alpha/beta subunit